MATSNFLLHFPARQNERSTIKKNEKVKEKMKENKMKTKKKVQSIAMTIYLYLYLNFLLVVVLCFMWAPKQRFTTAFHSFLFFLAVFCRTVLASQSDSANRTKELEGGEWGRWRNKGNKSCQLTPKVDASTQRRSQQN